MVTIIFKYMKYVLHVMIRTIRCPLPLDKDLVDTMQVYNKVVQYVIDMGWENRTCSKTKLHNLTYYDIRDEYPDLQSSLVQCARDMARAMIKREKFKHGKPIKKEFSGIVYNQRTFTPFSDSKKISISTINGRKKYDLIVPEYFQQYKDGKIVSMTLRSKNDKIIASLQLELDDIPINDVETFVGVDRGIKRVAACSNNKLYDTNRILATKWKYQQLRKELQEKGTRASKRKLKKVAGRERRFMTCENRKIANWVVDQPFDCIVLENLKGVKQYSKQKKKANKKLRKKFGNWAYYQLEQFIIERAEKLGKHVLFVTPKYTSQRCWQCGHISKKNRKNQSVFSCRRCGFELNADLNASRNMSDYGKAVFGRAPVNRPNKGIRSLLNVAVSPMTDSIESLGRVLVTSH